MHKPISNKKGTMNGKLYKFQAVVIWIEDGKLFSSESLVPPTRLHGITVHKTTI